jgi:flagellar assembly factor FliW
MDLGQNSINFQITVNVNTPQIISQNRRNIVQFILWGHIYPDSQIT